MRPSNMENANSPEYLEKIKNAVIENLKKTVPAPSVQMQDVPRQGFGTTTDDDDAALDDEDEDNNKDVRLTQRGFDKRTVADNEFEESDDEEMAEANGVYQVGGKRKGIQDYKNPFAQEDYDPTTAQNGNKQTTPAPEVQDKSVNEDADETMDDVQAQAQEEAETQKEVVAEPEPETAAPAADSVEAPTAPAEDAPTAQVDNDGDVDMAEAGEPDVVPSIKQEEADVQPTTTTAEPAPVVEKEPVDDKPAAEAAKDEAPAAVVDEKPKDETDAPPATESKEVEKAEQEKPASPAKPAEMTGDDSTKMDVEETAEGGGAEEATATKTTEEPAGDK